MPLATYKGLAAPSLRVEAVSLASTRVTLTQDQQGTLLVLDGSTGSTVEIALPTPEAGMEYWLYFTTGAAGAATKVISSAYDIRVVTTAKAVIADSTAEAGRGIHLIARSGAGWIVDRFGASSLGFTTATS